MSTQLKAQQGLTNLTPIKVIHILISLAIMVCFKFVPAAEPLTPLGVEVIGIFLGMLYGWLIANDSFWPSIFGLLFLGLSSYSTVPAVLRDGFGNSTVLLLFFFFAFTNIISAAGITENIAMEQRRSGRQKCSKVGEKFIRISQLKLTITNTKALLEKKIAKSLKNT